MEKGKSSNETLRQHRDRILPPIVEALSNGQDESLVERIMSPDLPEGVRTFITFFPVKQLREKLMMVATPKEAEVLGGADVIGRLERIQNRVIEVHKARKEALKKAAGN